ncbi:hypothetical protein RRG08_011323 [Elysia crispata]|uniref:Uncharacterized protein n=1 Tax=Elysia crispata TaxID=231223 RepID=A0AAE0YDB9_9GAST|nr:hypothetical protein RRG08_011323 [Elysia crispata]
MASNDVTQINISTEPVPGASPSFESTRNIICTIRNDFIVLQKYTKRSTETTPLEHLETRLAFITLRMVCLLKSDTVTQTEGA